MSKIVMVATEKPFAPEAVAGIRAVLGEAGYHLVLLENYATPAELLDAVKTSDALIVRSDRVAADVIAAAENLRIVVRAGAGYDNIDCVAAAARNVVAMNTPGQNANAVAELVFGLMLQLARKQYSGKSGTELRGKVLGIHAYGAIGKNVARIAAGFGMTLQAFDPFIPEAQIANDGVTPVSSVDELYRSSDYVSLHIPATAETRRSIGYELLSQMKAGGALINTARKEVIDEDGLIRILEERKDFRYASDLTPDAQSDIRTRFADQIFFTAKKMGAQTAEANINAGIAAAQQIVRFFEQGDTAFRVN